MNIIKDEYHIRLETNNGASYSIPIEVVKGIKNGDIDQGRYVLAGIFLNGEDKKANLGFEQVKQLFEENV